MVKNTTKFLQNEISKSEYHTDSNSVHSVNILELWSKLALWQSNSKSFNHSISASNPCWAPFSDITSCGFFTFMLFLGFALFVENAAGSQGAWSSTSRQTKEACCCFAPMLFKHDQLFSISTTWICPWLSCFEINCLAVKKL